MQNTIRKPYTEPKISPAHPDSSSMRTNWYVWFRCYDPTSDSWRQVRYKHGINEFTNFRERLAEANALKQVLKEKLKEGWNPFVVEQNQVIRIYSLEEAINYIQKIKEATLSTKSKYAYRYILALFQDWLKLKTLLSTGVKHFTGRQAQEYMDWLLIKKSYAGRTFNDHLIVLRTFFNCFIDREWIANNPFRAVKRKIQTIGRNLAYTEKEKSRMEEVLIAKDPRMYYFTQIMFHCFIRRTEMTFLKVKHVDIINNTIVIPGEHAKNNHQESVVIPKGLEHILKEMKLENHSSEDYIFGRKLLTGPLQFKNPNWISTRHNNIVKQEKIDPEKGLYSWKHTGVCHYYHGTGKDVYALMRQLRHRDLNTTMIYLKSMGLIQNDAFRNALVA